MINNARRAFCGALIRSISRISWRGALIGPTSDDTHFARLLNLKESAAMLTERGFLWSAAVADATTLGLSPEVYLSRVDRTVQSFLRRNVLHDRDAISSDIQEVWRGEGQLGLVLGGKSVGKSFLLRMLAEQQNEACRAHRRLHAASSMPSWQHDSAAAICPRRVIVYDAREAGSDLSRGLVSVLKGDPSFFQQFKQAFKAVAERGAAAAVTAAASGSPLATHASELGTATGKVASDVLDVFLDGRPLPLNQVLAAYILCCNEAGNYPCLVIDEASVALAAESTAARKNSLEALHLLVKYTKQLRQMNVILAASEHSEPRRLNALGFKSDHWTFTRIVGEIPPKAMREQLINTWGLGNHMADAVMSVWGGHVWAVANGLKWLKLKKEDYRAIHNSVAFSLDAIRGAVYCAQEGDRGKLKGMAGMRGMLLSVAERGYAPFITEDDPCVALGSLRNVWGVVGCSTFAPSVPPEAWDEDSARRFIVVPASQSMRLLLASELGRTPDK